MNKFWSREPFLIGMVHLPPLPGSARFAGDGDACLAQALRDGQTYADAGVDVLLVENHGDAPFAASKVAPHVPAWLALVTRDLISSTGLPVGINCLRNDAMAALGAASAAGATFIRVNVLVGATATDQGIIEGCAQELLAYRSALGTSTAILADLNVKFGTPLFRPSPADAVASLVARGGADGVIVTGSATGTPPAPDEVAAARGALEASVPLLVGSGVTTENIRALSPGVTGFIVGTSLKEGGDVAAPVDAERVRTMVAAVRDL